MKKTKLTLFFFLMISTFFAVASAAATEPSSCVSGTFSKTGSQYWSDVSLTIVNRCGVSVDLQNAIITFANQSNLNTDFWGDFGVVSYPDNILRITSTNRKYPDIFSIIVRRILRKKNSVSGVISSMSNNELTSVKFGKLYFFDNALYLSFKTSRLLSSFVILQMCSSKKFGIFKKYFFIFCHVKFFPKI